MKIHSAPSSASGDTWLCLQQPLSRARCGSKEPEQHTQKLPGLPPAERAKRRLPRLGALVCCSTLVAVALVAANLGMIELDGGAASRARAGSNSGNGEDGLCEAKWREAVGGLLAGVAPRSLTDEALFRVPAEMGDKDSLTLFQVHLHVPSHLAERLPGHILAVNSSKPCNPVPSV